MVRGLDQVRLHQGDGVDMSLAIWKKAVKPNSALFFVDGDHAEHSVYRELSAIMRAVTKPVVLLHDTFYQSSESSCNVGPYQAIQKVLDEEAGRFKRLDSGIGLPSMTLLYPA
jgi:hypothetical protein